MHALMHTLTSNRSCSLPACRGILSEGQVPPRTGYIIQNLMMARKGKFSAT